MLFLYRISIGLYGLIVWIFSFFNHKAKLFISGRKDIFRKLRAELKKGNGPLIWIHAASVGEFEQGRPIIEEIKQRKPDCQVLLTFFSPSGYELRKEYALADYVYYLPLDTPANAIRFIEIVQPNLAIFIKYEFWYFYLRALQQKQIPTLFVSCIFRENQFFFGRPGKFYQKVLKKVDHYFLQDEGSARLLDGIGVTQYVVSGDSRFDRVAAVAAQAKEVPLATAFKGNSRVWVLGSIWPSDMLTVTPFIEKHIDEFKFIIAPHNIEDQDIEKLLKLPGSIRFSQSDEATVREKRVLIVDSIGMLSSLYRYGDYALVGGAFNGTLHNTLEPSVYGIPVFFGEDRGNVKFLEAKGLIAAGAGFTFSEVDELEEKFSVLEGDEKKYRAAASSAAQFVKDRTGATKMVMDKINQILFSCVYCLFFICHMEFA